MHTFVVYAMFFICFYAKIVVRLLPGYNKYSHAKFWLPALNCDPRNATQLTQDPAHRNAFISSGLSELPGFDGNSCISCMRAPSSQHIHSHCCEKHYVRNKSLMYFVHCSCLALSAGTKWGSLFGFVWFWFFNLDCLSCFWVKMTMFTLCK